MREGNDQSQKRNRKSRVFTILIYSTSFQTLLALMNQYESMTTHNILYMINNTLPCVNLDIFTSNDNAYLMRMLSGTKGAIYTGKTNN